MQGSRKEEVRKVRRIRGMELWRSANFLSFFMSTVAKRSGDISVLVMSLVMWRNRNRNGSRVQGTGARKE